MALRINIAELRKRLGTRRDIRRDVAVDDMADLVGVAGTVVRAGGTISLDLVLESVPEGITAVGAVVAPFAAECRRCLEPVEGEVHLDIHEVFERQPTPGETYPMDDDAIDLEPMLRDAVLLGLPLSVLCSTACPGPDPDRFPTTVEADAGGAGGAGEGAEGDEAAAEPPGDPRWAALRELRFDD